MTPHDARAFLAKTLSKEQVAAIQVLFPNRLPDTVVPPQDLGVLVGKQTVIATLKGIVEAVERRSRPKEEGADV